MTKTPKNVLVRNVENICVRIGPYVLFTTLFCILIELVSLAVLQIYSSSTSDDGRNPTRYTNEVLARLYPDWSPTDARAMLKEVWLERPPQYEPLVEYSEAPFSGKFVNVSPEGFRIGKTQKSFDDNSTKKVFVFGGSTTFGSGVADKDTIASYLQEILDSNSASKQYAVFNFGVGYYYSTLERIRLEKFITAGTIPDIAIFIDGLNDFSFYHLPDKTSQSNYLAYLFNSPRISLALGGLATTRLAEKVTRRLFGVGLREKASSEDISKAAARLERNWKIISSLGTTFNFRPLLVLQPLAFAGDTPEQSLVPLDEEFDRAVEQVRLDVRAGYRHILEQRAIGSIPDRNMLWLNDFTIETNMFVDYVHYSPAFSKAIAEQIASRILQSQP